MASEGSLLRIQDYTVKTCDALGEGGLGTVYTAEHGSGKLVAIKIGYAMDSKDFTWCVARPLPQCLHRGLLRDACCSHRWFLVQQPTPPPPPPPIPPWPPARRQTALTEWNTYVALTHGQPCRWLPRVYHFGVYACPGGVAPWYGGPG